jgi:hypothetical protein
LNDSEKQESSEYDLKSDYNQELVFYPVDSSEKEKISNIEGSFSGLGNTREGAVADAIENLAIFIGADIEAEKDSHQSQSEGAFASSINSGVDQVVKINDIDVREIDDKDIKENPWQKHFKYIVDIKY